jgi:hypothetical protein
MTYGNKRFKWGVFIAVVILFGTSSCGRCWRCECLVPGGCGCLDSVGNIIPCNEHPYGDVQHFCGKGNLSDSQVYDKYLLERIKYKCI